MVRLSCFSNPSHHHRSKKLVKSLSEVTQTSLNSNPKVDGKNATNSNVDQHTSSHHEDCWRSEDFNFCTENESRKIKKSQSLGDMLEKEDLHDFDNINNKREDYVVDSFDENNHIGGCNSTSSVGLYDEKKENHLSCSDDLNDPHQHECLSSLGNSEQLNEKQCDFEDDALTYHLVNSEVQSSLHQPVLTRSHSVNLEVHISNFIEDGLNPAQFVPRSRSFGNLCSALEGVPYTEEARVSPGHCEDVSEDCVQSNAQSRRYSRDEKINGKSQIEDSACNNSSVDEISQCYVESGDDCHHSDITSTAAVTLARDGNLIEDLSYGDLSHNACNTEDICQETDHKKGATLVENCEPESCYQNCSMLSPEEFNVRRIENWICQIAVSNDMAVDEQGECSSSAAHLMNSQQVGNTTKLNSKGPLGMETAYNYIATLKPSSSVAQLSNLWLVAIPILSAFSGLRLLNLAANSIIRITSGAIPKGLHMLNLSRNNISTIEGLRELTRLRILDLSYNRIAKIGHGLSSCSSLKELYLAGNKISEVEGLHRLLKLKVLDLHFNKISTSKCLGQLANCNTLQSVNLEGNPAQKNVGDEQLKKYVLSLLPRLVYYNKQAMRSRFSKDDRHGRAISSDRGDRSKRLNLKLPRSSAGSSTALKSSRSQHFRSVHGSVKPSKSRNVPVVPAIPKADHPSDGEMRLPGLQIDGPIRRIQSAGNKL